MIKAIIFDCFGVLATDGWLPFKSKYFAHDPELLKQATILNKQADSGVISYRDFVEAIARLAGLTSDQTSRAINNNVPNEPLFDYITKLKAKYKIGVLSNAAANWLDVIFSESQIALFDAVTISCDSGFLKPDKRAYQMVTNKLGSSTDEAIFVDDMEVYVNGAREAGLKAIYYQSFDQMKKELEQLLA